MYSSTTCRRSESDATRLDQFFLDLSLRPKVGKNSLMLCPANGQGIITPLKTFEDEGYKHIGLGLQV